MKILVHGINYLPELTGIGKYTGELCEWLVARGHEVHVICAVPYYPEWVVPDAYRGALYRVEERNGAILYRSRLFVPIHPRTATRLLHLLSFALLSALPLLRHWKWRPDVVIGIEPTLFCAPATLLASRLFGAKSLLHIQDFEPDAMLGLGMGKVGSLGTRIERWLMKHFDAISTISNSMTERAASKVGDGGGVLLFPNWVDTDFMKPGRSGDFYRKGWGIPQRAKVVLYAGNMGKKQGLEIVLKAALLLKDLDDVVFVLVGAGAVADHLKSETQASALANVRFFTLQPYENLPELMALADVHLVVQRRGAAEAVLPSKLTTILAAGGNALITAESHTELGRLCERNPGIAVRVEPEDPTSFTDALRELLGKIDVENRRPNAIARAYAERHLDKRSVLAQFESDLIRLVSG